MPNIKVSQQLINRFWEYYKTTKSYSVAWRLTYEWSLADGAARGLANPGQGWNSASGTAFEEISKGIIIEQVKNSRLSSQVSVVRWGDAPQSIREGILSELVWLKGQISQPERAESNVDVIAMLNEEEKPVRVVSVYSYKSSTAERYQQDLYWAEKLKARSIHFCFVTIEDSFVRYATSLKKPQSATKSVTLSQALYDKIYLLTEDPIAQNPLVFRNIDSVLGDLDLWIQAY